MNTKNEMSFMWLLRGVFGEKRSYVKYNQDQNTLEIRERKLFFCCAVYIFESILAYLTVNAEEADEREPSGPHDYVMHILQIKHAKYEYELEENEIPEVIFYVLILDGSQLAKNKHLQQFAEQDETAVAEVDQ